MRQNFSSFNQNYYKYVHGYGFPSYNYNSPFNVPRMGGKDVTRVKKGFTLNSALTNAEKGIDTISSIIPIYQKVKPIVENGKDFINLIKTKLVKTKEKKVEKVEPELVDPMNKTEKETIKETKKKEEKEPNAPYF